MTKIKQLKTVLISTACVFALGGAAHADNFNIPSGDLKSALRAYMSQTGVTLLVSGDTLKGAQTSGVTGSLSADNALSQILKGTGFTAKRDASGLIGIIPERASNAVQPLELAQASPSAGRIEEVLVTARKREEAIENIPISITALSAEDLKTFGVRNFADLEGLVPGLNLGGGGNGVKKDSSPFIRGVGQRETKVTLDPAVATYIDGIYIGRAAGAMLDVIDTDNIQVLRGPQGTLFGRNATGGAISVTLKKPNNSWEAQVSANVGNYGRHDVSGTLNIPFIADKVLGRLTVSSANNNGYFTNIVDNTKWGGDNRITGIAQLRFLPTDRITIDILGERTHIRETPRPQKCEYIKSTVTVQTGYLNTWNAPAGKPSIMQACINNSNQVLPASQFESDLAIGNDLMPKARYYVDTSTVGATVGWDIGDVGMFSDVSAKSISAWRRTEQIADEDIDAMSLAIITRIQPHADKTTQLSQELQLSGKTWNDRLFLNTGFYYFQEKTPNNVLHLSAGVGNHLRTLTTQSQCNSRGGGAPAPCTAWYAAGFEPAREKLETDNKALAWYGQADFDITPEIQLTGGIRWTQEKHWSRYSKGGLVPGSLVYGTVWQAQSNQFLGTTESYSNTPGLRPITDWQFLPYTGDALSKTDSAWTPMVSLKYKAHERVLNALGLDQAMAYATYSVGFHSGGVTSGAIDFNRNATADPQIFHPEKVVNYEVGFKATGLDRRVQANLSLFYMDYTDMQVTAAGNRFGIPVPYIDNVGASVIQGVEAEMVVLPTPDWRVVLNGSYTDADIKEWQARQEILPLSGGPPNSYQILDRSDERMPRVPRWQFFAASEYNFRLPGGSILTPSVAVRFTSSIYHGFDRGSWTYSYGGYYWNDGGNGFTGYGVPLPPGGDPLVPHNVNKWSTSSRPTAFFDARIAWVSEDGKLDAALWGKNLTNKDDYLVGGIPLADVTGAVGQVFANPRTFGLTFTYHFGE